MKFKETSGNNATRTEETSSGSFSPIVTGYAWVVRITTFCFEFAALILLGKFVDARFGVSPWGVVLCGVVGVYVFVSGLISTVKSLNEIDDDQGTKK